MSTSKDKHAGKPAILWQPRKEWNDSVWRQFLSAQFEYYGVPLLEPQKTWKEVFEQIGSTHTGKSEGVFVQTTSLRAVILKMIERECVTEDAYDLLIPEIKKTNDREYLWNIYDRLTSLYAPAYKDAARDPWREKKWTLAEEILLVARMENCFRINSKFGWSEEKAANSLLSLHPKIGTAKALARCHKNALKRMALMVRVLRDDPDERMENIIREFVLKLTGNNVTVRRYIELQKNRADDTVLHDLEQSALATPLLMLIPLLLLKKQEDRIFRIYKGFSFFLDPSASVPGLTKAESENLINLEYQRLTRDTVNSLETELSAWKFVDEKPTA